MTAETKFKKMFYKMPEKMRFNLFYYSTNIMSLNVVMIEVKNKTELGKNILNELGFEDEE